MNQARKSSVLKLPSDSVDYSLVKSLCTQNVDDNLTTVKPGKWVDFKRTLIKVKKSFKFFKFFSFEFDITYSIIKGVTIM